MEENRSKMNKRMLVVILVFAALACGLIGRLFYLQVVKYDYYLGKVLDNITKETSIKAERGTIYDRNMLQLATNVTTYRIFIDPYQMAKDMEKDPTKRIQETVSEQLSSILGLNYSDVYSEAQKSKYRDRTIKREVEKAQADLIRTAIDRYGLGKYIYLEEMNTRFYPYGTLASQVIGVMGTDSGLFGLEYNYNSYLTGTDGVKKTTTDARGESMPSKYDAYVAAEDGWNLISTIDVTLQNILEKALEQTTAQNNPTNGVCGIIMDVNTGEILAMAVFPNFDLNDPYTLAQVYKDELTMCGYTVGTEEYNDYYWNLVNKMWKNKAITDTYYPGSTFKIITTSMALEEKVIKPSDIFTCTGAYKVADRSIKCAKNSGHGTHDFTYLLQQSCNPTMIQVGQKVGTEKFLNYFENFGFTEKTGIDLPGEALGITYDRSAFRLIDLAVSSFGQGFSTTVIRELTAISAVANGGYLVTPHLVSAMTDGEGNVVWSNDNATKRQVVSSSVCKTVTEILADGVTNNGAARNAYVAGYEIAAKTGTSEKIGVADNTLRIGSCVGYAPADDPQIAVIIVVDEPHSASRAGGVVAAPYVAQVMSEALPYLGFSHNYTEDELDSLTVTASDYTGLDVAEAKTTIQTLLGAAVVVRGSGDIVTAQIPASGSVMMASNAKVILYTGDMTIANEPTIEVPTVVGMSVSAAITTLINSGFNVNITGALNYDTGSGAVVQAQEPSGKLLKVPGTVVTIDCIHIDVVDDA